MKILVITPGFLPAIGGAEIGVHEIYCRLGKRHQVTILTAALKNPYRVEGFDQSHYTVRRYPDWLNFGQVGGRMLYRGVIPPFSIGALYGAIKTIRELRPDVVNVHYAAYTGLAAVWAQKGAGIPTVLSLIGRDAVPGVEVPRLWPWYASLVARQVAHTIFISRFCQTYYHGLPFPQSVIPYGADVRRIQPRPADDILREQLGLSPDTRVLFTLQRLSAIKHVEVAIQSVRDLVEQGMDDFILLVGGSGPEEKRLRRLVEGHKLQKYVRFLGFVPEASVERCFSLADLFVFPSIFETFGIVLAQAMAAGLPIVAADCSSIPEVVQDGVTGLLSPPLDHLAMAENIRKLLDDEVLRDRMGRAARQRAAAVYDWDRVALQYEQVLSQAVEGRTKDRP